MKDIQIKIPTILQMLDLFGDKYTKKILNDVQSGRVSVKKLEELIFSKFEDDKIPSYDSNLLRILYKKENTNNLL